MEFATIHFDPSAEPSPSRVRRLLELLLFTTLKDRAAALKFTYEPGLIDLSYRVAGEWHELSPPPIHLGPRFGEATRRLINPSGFHRSLADQLRRLANRFDPREEETIHYHFMLIVGPTWSLWKATIREGGGRGQITFEVIECPEWTYDQMRRIEPVKSNLPRDDIDLINPSRLHGD